MSDNFLVYDQSNEIIAKSLPRLNQLVSVFPLVTPQDLNATSSGFVQFAAATLNNLDGYVSLTAADTFTFSVAGTYRFELYANCNSGSLSVLNMDMTLVATIFSRCEFGNTCTSITQVGYCSPLVNNTVKVARTRIAGGNATKIIQANRGFLTIARVA
jgi:hypothetical protein